MTIRFSKLKKRRHKVLEIMIIWDVSLVPLDRLFCRADRYRRNDPEKSTMTPTWVWRPGEKQLVIVYDGQLLLLKPQQWKRVRSFARVSKEAEPLRGGKTLASTRRKDLPTNMI